MTSQAKYTTNENESQQAPIDLVLSLLPGAKSSSRGYTACCPAHNDKSPSLEIWEDEKDGHVGLICYAGCQRKAICDALSIEETDLYRKDTRFKPRAPRSKIDLLDLARDKIIPPAFLINLGLVDMKNGGVRIPYYKMDGQSYFVRMRTALKAKEGSYWEKGTKALPYGLDRLAAATDYLPIVEGDSNPWTLWLHGLPALGIPGAKMYNKIEAEHVAVFPPKVYIFQDPDESGEEFVSGVAKRINELGYKGEILAINLKASHDVKDLNDLHKKLHADARLSTFKAEWQKALDSATPVDIHDLPKKRYLPQFIIEGQMREQVKKSLDLLEESNTPNPLLFVYLSMVSKIARNEHNEPVIKQVDRATLRNELNNVANFYTEKKDKNGDPVLDKDGDPFLVVASPPKDIADQMLALAPSEWPLPPLKSIVEAPVLRPDGSILNNPGYDQKTQLYYVPGPGMERCKIPENPTQEDAIEAMNRLKALFADFPFEGDADYANTLALLFTPFVRHAVKKDIQMALIDATNAGTGKGLITIVVSIIATGKPTTPMSAKRDDEEWRKALLTELLQAPRIVIIDNVRGTLESATLELILTGGGINERILGQSKSAKARNEATFMATGNNLLIGGDLPRRCMRIRLISQTANPEERDDFKIADLEQHTIDNRPEYVSDVLTVARAWYAAGKPKPKGVPNLGTFTDWAKTVGGMLEFAGIEGFQANRDELRRQNNEEAQESEAFLSSWVEVFGDNWKHASDIVAKITKDSSNEIEPPANPLFDTLPKYLRKALADKPRSFDVTLSRWLGKRVQTVYGSEGFRIEKQLNKNSKTNQWRVMRGVAGGSPSPTQGRNFSSYNPEESINKANGIGPIDLPQPTASDDSQAQNGKQFAGGSLKNASLDELFGDVTPVQHPVNGHRPTCIVCGIPKTVWSEEKETWTCGVKHA